MAVIGVHFVERGNGDRLGLLTKGELEVAQLAYRVESLFGPEWALA
jgi:hypothetical protein